MKRTLQTSSTCSQENKIAVEKELALGYFNLSDEMFDQAQMNFRLAIKLDPKCADAFWGLMLAKCQMKSEELLFTEPMKFKNVVFLEEYKKALELAEENQKKHFENLLTQIRQVNSGDEY